MRHGFYSLTRIHVRVPYPYYGQQAGWIPFALLSALILAIQPLAYILFI